jgi:hypothetical protein
MRSRFQQLLLSKAVGVSVEKSGENDFSRVSPEQSSFQRVGATTPARPAARRPNGQENFLFARA